MKKIKSFKIDNVFAFMSFGVFAASMLVTLLFGASVYKNIVEKSGDGEGERLRLSYIWTKIKTNDTAGNIYIEEFCGLPALSIYEEYEGVKYKTVIYEHKGCIYELFSETGLEFSADDGTPVMESMPLHFEQLENGLIKISVNSESLFVYPRGRTVALNEH